MSGLSVVAVIPARFGSTRLPGKPLADVGGRPLIRYVWEAVRRARRIGRVLVATDDERIRAAVAEFGGEARLTSHDHRTGSDRIGELLPEITEDVVMNVQGDEPELDPDLLDELVTRLEDDPSCAVTTAATPFPEGRDPADPHSVKVVTDLGGRALYFSRAPIPGSPEGRQPHRPLLHLGVYAYRREALVAVLGLQPGQLEVQESLEQLRLIENGIPVGVVRAVRAHKGIDTAPDLEAFRTRLDERPGVGS